MMASGCFAFGMYGAIICYSPHGTVQCVHPASVAQQYSVPACSAQGEAGAQPAATESSLLDGLDPDISNLWMGGAVSPTTLASGDR